MATFTLIKLPLLLVVIAIPHVSTYLCNRNATFDPCISLDAFPILTQIMANLSVVTILPNASAPVVSNTTTNSSSNATSSANVTSVSDNGINARMAQIYNYTDALCRVAQPIINCINSVDFKTCEAEQDVNPEAQMAVGIYNSFRLINFGCTLWLSGGSDIENDCPNYQSLFDKCAQFAPNIPLLKDFSIFLNSQSSLFTLPKINSSDCDPFKLRTGCIVNQFSNNCKTPRSADLPWWMGRYQLDLSRSSSSSCSFTSDDTAAKLSEIYVNTLKATNGRDGNVNQYYGGGSTKSSAQRQRSSLAILASVIASSFYSYK